MPGTLTGGTRRHRAHPLRALVAIATAVLVFQAGYVAPVGAATGPRGPVAPVAAPATREASPATVPDGAAIESPATSPTPAPTEAVTPSATASPGPTDAQAGVTPLEPAQSAGPVEPSAHDAADTLPPLPAGATELVAERDAYSRVYRDATGKLSREIFADPVFYQATPDAAFVPIEAGFTAVAGADRAVVSDKAPAVVTVRPADDPRGFLALETDGFRVAYHPLVTDGQVDRAAAAAEAVIDGRRADLAEVFPGVDLRVFARAEGANTFLVLAAAPTEPRWTFLVDLPKGARLATNPETGGVDIVDATGAVRMRVAAPWATDSTPDEFTGSGRTTTALHYELGEFDGTPTLTVSLDDTDWLATAVYPVYVDPTTTIENGGTHANGDTFANRGNKSMNYGNYQRPDSPYYYEMWLGESPSDSTYYNMAYINWATGVLEDLGIDSATVKIRPYHQYYNAPTTTRTWLRQVTADWAENTLTWNLKPTVASGTVDTADCVESSDCAFDVTSLVRKWADDTEPDYGIRLDENDNGPTYWKRLIAAEDGTSSKVPRLVVTYHDITTTATTPSFSHAVSWDYADANSLAQTRYWVQIYSDAAMTTKVVDTGYVTSTASTYAPAAGALTDLATYHFKVRAGNATGAAPWATGSFVYDAQQRGAEPYYARVSNDLGGGWTLDVGVHNGEARMTRDLFSIPSYGPAQELALTYSSLEPGTTGRFGVGWSSNLTEYLTFDATDPVTIWHRADGGRVPFVDVGGTWTPPAGHYETMTVAGSEATVTTRDQTRYVFESSGAGRLKRIENRFGKALTLVWNTSSATATDASGRATTITIDSGNNRITAVTDSAGRIWTFGYAGTDLATVTEPDPDGAGSLAAPVTTLGYDASHHLTTITRSRSRASGSPQTLVWTIGYTSGKATSVVDPIAHASYGDVASTFSYGSGSTVAALLKDYSPVARSTSTYTVDDHGRVTALTDAEGYQTTWTFDASSNPTAISRPDAGTTTYAYDARGNVTRETTPIDGSISVVSKMTYNATNDLTSRWEATGVADTATTPDQLATTYTYTAGQLTEMNVNCTSSGTTMPTFSAGCTGNGTLDAATNLITTYTYTANGQLETETDPLGRVTKHTYDTVGNETSTIRNYLSGQPATADQNVTTTFAYDEGTTPDAGLLTTETDPLGNATTYAYDALGRMTTEVLAGDAAGDATIPELTRTTGYDELNNVLTETESWTPLAGGSAVNRTTTHVYDLANRETSSTDPEGVATSRTYDAAGNMLTETASGATTTRTYDGLGRTVTEDASGVATSYMYDGQGNVTTSITDGVDRAMTYDLAGRLETETEDASGLALTTSHAYDRLGRETATTDPNGVLTTTTYDRAGRTSSTIANDVAGTPGAGEDQTTSYAYDRAGNQTGVTDPAGTLTTTVYDALDRATTTIANDVASPSGPDQDVTTRTLYDAAGNVVATVDPGGIVARTILNVRNLPVTTLGNCVDDPPGDPEDCTGSATPTASVNVKRTTTFDGRGDVEASVLHRVGAVGVETRETRDGAGRMLSSVLDAGAGRLNLTTEYAYDNAGRQVAVRDPRGTITRTFYDANGRITKSVVNCTNSGTTVPTTGWETCAGTGTADGTFNLTTSYAYDARGNRTSETAPNGRLTTFIYDDANRLMTRIDNDVAGTPAANEDLLTYFYYDDAGRLVAVKAPTTDRTTFAVTRSFYDDLGRLEKQVQNCVGGATPDVCPGTSPIDADQNITTTYAYDDAGRMVAMTSPDPSATSGTSSATVTTRYAYDAVGRLCRVLENASVDLATLADPCSTAVSGTATTNLSTRYTYDAAGNLASMIDAAGHTTGYGYDAAGHMTSRTDALDGTIRWKYDEAGNRIRQENRADPPYSNSVVWTYDAAGRMLTRVADGATTAYTYDANGNKLTASAGGLTITATYDRLGRVLTVDDEDADTTADTTYTYSLTSPSWSDPTGSYAATLDAFDRAVSLTDPASASGWTFSYRADGQLGSSTAGNSNTTTQTYDATGRLLDRNTKTGSTSRAHYVYTYNRAGMILSEASTITGDAANGTVAYAYDPLGQLTGSTLSGTTTAYGWDKTTNRTSVQVGGGTAATTAYDAANRPTSGANPTAAYASDADGRLTARPGQTMTWDHLGRLTAVTTGSGTTTYSYDPLDRLRTVDYGGGSRIRFRYVGMTTAAAQWLDDVAGTVTRSIGNGWGGERLLDWTGTSSNRRTYGTNAHHDVTWLAKDDGTVLQSLRYDPWGTPRSTPPQDYTPFRFQGSWNDQTTDLAWVVTRWYAPSMGRFVSEDSLLGEPREPDSRHLYAYAAGEPVGAWDPDGRCSTYDGYFRLLCSWTTFHEEDTVQRVSIVANAGLTLACLFATTLTVGVACAAGAMAIGLAKDPGDVYGRPIWRKTWWYQSYPGIAVQERWQYGWEYRVAQNCGAVSGGDCPSWRTRWKGTFKFVKTWHFKDAQSYLAQRCWQGRDLMVDCDDLSSSFRHVYRTNAGYGPVWKVDQSTHWPRY
jgi:RHS repeat-associated protein